MEIKGIITLGSSVSLNCCDSIPNDILIDGKSLYEAIDDNFSGDPENDDTTDDIFLRYVILDEPQNKDFDLLKGEVIVAIIVGQNSGACYSEYTCGWGGFNYFHKQKGHSIFQELEQYVGKFIHLKA